MLYYGVSCAVCIVLHVFQSFIYRWKCTVTSALKIEPKPLRTYLLILLLAFQFPPSKSLEESGESADTKHVVLHYFISRHKGPPGNHQYISIPAYELDSNCIDPETIYLPNLYIYQYHFSLRSNRKPFDIKDFKTNF